MRKILVTLICIICLASSGFAQQQTSGDNKPPAGQNVTNGATSTAGAAVTLNNSGGLQSPIIPSTPFLLNSAWGSITLGDFQGPFIPMTAQWKWSGQRWIRYNTMDQIRAFAKGHGNLEKVRMTYSGDEKAVAKNDDPVQWLDYDPKGSSSIATGTTHVTGPNDTVPVYELILRMKKQYHMRYILVLGAGGKGMRTEGSAKALGSILSAVSGHVAGAVAPSITAGTTTAFAINIKDIQVFAYGDDVAPPPPPLSPAPPVVAPAPQAPVVPAAPPTEEQKLQEIILKIQVSQAPATTPVLVTPTVKAPEVSSSICALDGPQVIYFDFGKSYIKAEYLPAIRAFSAILAMKGSECKYVIRGHTDKVGTEAYNASLGRDRAVALYYALLRDRPSLRDKLKLYDSAGKDFPASKEDPLNRRSEVVPEEPVK